jgi:hypothetical protein
VAVRDLVSISFLLRRLDHENPRRRIIKRSICQQCLSLLFLLLPRLLVFKQFGATRSANIGACADVDFAVVREVAPAETFLTERRCCCAWCRATVVRGVFRHGGLQERLGSVYVKMDRNLSNSYCSHLFAPPQAKIVHQNSSLLLLARSMRRYDK